MLNFRIIFLFVLIISSASFATTRNLDDSGLPLRFKDLKEDVIYFASSYIMADFDKKLSILNAFSDKKIKNPLHPENYVIPVIKKQDELYLYSIIPTEYQIQPGVNLPFIPSSTYIALKNFLPDENTIIKIRDIQVGQTRYLRNESLFSESENFDDLLIYAYDISYGNSFPEANIAVTKLQDGTFFAIIPSSVYQSYTLVYTLNNTSSEQFKRKQRLQAKLKNFKVSHYMITDDELTTSEDTMM